MRKTSILLVVALAIAYAGFALTAFGLPKDKSEQLAPGSSVVSSAAPAQKARITPVMVGPEEWYGVPPQPMAGPVYYRGMARRSISSANPYTFIRQGITETAQTNNHARDKVWVSSSGVIHMVYPIRNSDVDAIIKTPTDSNTAGMYYYNAYGCTGFNPPTLKSAPPGEDYPMSFTFTSIGDTRPRKLQAGGIFTADVGSGEVPVVYGHRLVQRTDLGTGLFSRRGIGTMYDQTECFASFSMDTTVLPENGTNASIEPVMWRINDSVWVATFNPQLVGIVGPVNWTYTTDYGKTWTPEATLNIYHPWIGGVDITSYTYTSGVNTGDALVYVYSLCDPNDPTSFTSTERPVYLRGDYDAGTGVLTWAGSMTDVTGDFEIPGFLPNMTGLTSTMRGDTLHMAWLDWNGHPTTVLTAGPGGHVHHAAILPDGSLLNNLVQKVADVKLDGDVGGWWGSSTTFGFAIAPWSQCDFSWDESRDVLYLLWSQPPDNGNGGYSDASDYGFGNYDIFWSASPNGGRAWDNPVNLTATNNNGCTGNPGNECENEFYFTAAPVVAHDTAWVFAWVQKAPGVQETALFRNPPSTSDPGPLTLHYDEYRLYKAQARKVDTSVRAELGPLPGDTIKFFQINLQPKSGTFTTPMRLSNIGLLGFTLDGVTLGAGLNDGFLVTTTTAVGGTPVAVGGAYDFNLQFNTNGVGPAQGGLRSGVIEAALTGAGGEKETLSIALNVYVVPSLCFNRKIQIHSGNNRSDIGTEGTVKNQAGLGLNYILGGTDRFYDGGRWLVQSNLNGQILPTGLPRRVSRAMFGTRNLRCLSDGSLDSTAGSGYYNLSLVSVSTDVRDSTLVAKSIWEQSTHPDSSDFLLQTVKLINVGTSPIDSVSMGVVYDIDLEGGTGPTKSTAGTNVSGDTVVSHLGRTWWMGWTAGNDVAVDTCSPNAALYGAVIIPGSIGSPGDFVRPRGSVFYKQIGFSYNISQNSTTGGDTLFQRYAWGLDVAISTRDRAYDTLTGVLYDTLSELPFNFVCNGDRNNGPPYRDDMGYIAVAKKVNNFPVNLPGGSVVASYGLEGLASGDDPSFNGVGESYAVIHVGSVTGLADLMDHAIKGIDWYVNHADDVAGPAQMHRVGDFNYDGGLSAADVSSEILYVFIPATRTVPLCVADINYDGSASAADISTHILGTFIPAQRAVNCPYCLQACFR